MRRKISIQTTTLLASVANAYRADGYNIVTGSCEQHTIGATTKRIAKKRNNVFIHFSQMQTLPPPERLIARKSKRRLNRRIAQLVARAKSIEETSYEER